MQKKSFRLFGIISLFIFFLSVAAAETTAPGDMHKRTLAGKYVTALQAYEMWKADPDRVRILDSRTPEEYALVGHPPMAYNIPSNLWTGKWNAKISNYEFKVNTDFEDQVKEKFTQSDTLLVICRSGHRSASAVNRLTKAGFSNVYSVIDGFEGDIVRDEESYFAGQRMKNGWKNSGAPWTYALNPKLIFFPEQQVPRRNRPQPEKSD